MVMYTMYSKLDCPYCVKAEAFLKMKKQPYQKLMLDKDFTREDILAKGAKTFPYITRDTDGVQEVIGGCDDLVRLLTK